MTTGTILPISLPAIRPAGLGQLLVVRQKLVRYELSEISHIENVLRSETRKRVHRRKVMTEEFSLIETEKEEFEEHNLQSTDRFELKTEVDQTISSEQEFKAGVNAKVSGVSYSVEANASYARKDARKDAMKSATNIAREVVDKSVTRFQEKVHEQRTWKLIHEVEEINEHSFTNTAADATNISGVYQWLEKIYDAQVFDYGLRTLYDVVIPEPAAMLVEAVRKKNKQTSSEATADLPSPPPLPPPSPNSISTSGYPTLVKLYRATDVEAPPEEFTTVVTSFAGRADKDWDEFRTAEKSELKIPPGYKAISAFIAIQQSGSKDEDTALTLLIGGRRVFFGWNSSKTRSINLHSEQEQIPVAIHIYKASAYAATVAIKCKRTSRALDEWRQRTYKALVSGYQTLVSEYEQSRATAEVELLAEVEGRSSSENRKIEEIEIKRAVISRLARTHYSLNGLETDLMTGLPRIDLAAAYANEPIIRFLEQAFEWENMTYLFYPYFWSRKSEWENKLLYSDVDQLFADFVKAGAARVQLPVREGFEVAVDHFTKTGKPWNGGPLPTITDNLYVPFHEEHKAQLGAPDNEVPFGDSWEVRVPTTLVKLRLDDRIPVFEGANADPRDPNEETNGEIENSEEGGND